MSVESPLWNDEYKQQVCDLTCIVRREELNLIMKKKNWDVNIIVRIAPTGDVCQLCLFTEKQLGHTLL